MNSNKTVVLTSNTSWYLYNFRKNTITALVQLGYNVICLAPKDGYSAKLVELGSQFIAVPLEGKSINPFAELKVLAFIYRQVKEIKPYFVFNFTIKMNLYFGIVCRVLSVPYANNVTGLGTVFLHDGAVHKLAKKLYGFANKGAETVFFQNSEDRDLFVGKCLIDENKSLVLPGSGVDTDRFSYAEMPSYSAFTFIMIARLIGDKGVREFVEAARRVKQVHPDVRFVLVGPTGVSNKTAISSREISDWKQEAVVEIVGEQSDVLPWLMNAHVFVLPSYREGMPKTVLEAAAVGRPSIVTDVPGCRQSIIEGETGWLCKARSSVSLAEVMIHVHGLTDAELQKFSKNARQRAEVVFSEKIVIQHYLDCLERVGVTVQSLVSKELDSAH